MIKLFQFHFIVFILISGCSFGQFQFSGEVNKEYLDATVYLSVVENCKNIEKLQLENILATSKTDSLGNFSFKGNYLSQKDLIYSIHIDKCFEEIKGAKHLLHECVDAKNISFIANNNDSIHFSLNSLNQMLCDFSFSRKENTYLQKIDALQEELLSGIEKSLNQKQRGLIFKNYFLGLKKYGQTLNHPLAELYAYHLYAEKNEFSKKAFLEDFHTSDYYANLNNELKTTYSNNLSTEYEQSFKLNSSLFNKEEKNYTAYVLGLLLLISVLLNAYLLFNKYKKPKAIDIAKTLTQQELKIFHEINAGLTNKQIAEKLFISVSTVKTHINNIYSKLEISSRKELLGLK